MHLIVFSHLRWDFVWQRPQHVLSRLARSHKVLFMEEPVFSGGSPKLEVVRPLPDVDVLRVHTPKAGQGFADDQLGVIHQLLTSHLLSQGVADYVVWFYTPMALPLLDGLRPRAIVYDCMDELAAFKDAPVHLREREAQLLQRADVVFTGGPSLHEAKRDHHPNVLCLPSGVDAEHYSPRRALADEDAMQRARELQRHIGYPRLGFFGVIDERLDIELVDELASTHPGWHLVMVGPVVKISPERLPHRENIHWLGQQPYGLLPQLVAGWDVCLLPFALNESTRFISPTKTLEYMAGQKPVVSTPVRDVALLYGDNVRIACAGLEFAQACRQALSESPGDAEERNARMRTTVLRYSWDETADTMLRAIGSAVTAAAPAELPAAA